MTEQSVARREPSDVHDSDLHVVLAAGSTATARIDGISAAGAEPSLLAHTPSADAELLAYGDVIEAPAVPASPTGCPTPALVTRAARDVLEFDASVVDAGLAAPSGAPTVDVGAAPGADVRDAVAVPDAAAIARQASEWAQALPVDRIAVAETIPGGTTTALGVLRALGERPTVSSSLPENPIERKQAVVADGLDASGLAPGDCASEPYRAIRAVGDPVQATVLGLLDGALAAGTAVELWGGTQMLAVVAAARHAEIVGDLDAFPPERAPLRVVTTSYVAEDESAAVRELTTDLEVPLVAAEPGFAASGHVGLERFATGEAKEGVGMGGALALAERGGVLDAVRDRFRALYDELLDSSGDAAPGRDVDAGADVGSGGGEPRGP